MRKATIRRPRVDVADFVTRVYVSDSWQDFEIDLVDPDTGLVVYTTPAGDKPAAIARARRFAARRGLKIVPAS